MPRRRYDCIRVGLRRTDKIEYEIGESAVFVRTDVTQESDWEDELFDALGLSKSLMQEIVQPGSFIGKLDNKIARQLGSKSFGTPISNITRLQNWGYQVELDSLNQDKATL